MRAEWMKSTLLTVRPKRCLTRAWSRRSPRLDKKFGNRHAYLKHRVRELEERVKKTAEHIRPLRGCLLGRVGELLLKTRIMVTMGVKRVPKMGRGNLWRRLIASIF